MTQKWVYACGTITVIAALLLNITSLARPDWITLKHTNKLGDPITVTFGLVSRCVAGECLEFPDPATCTLDNGQLCGMWRVARYLMTVQRALLVFVALGFGSVLAVDNRRWCDQSWKVLSLMLGLAVLCGVGAVSIIDYLLNHDVLFNVPGYQLHVPWYLCIGSAVVTSLCFVGLLLSGLVFPEKEGGIRLLVDPSTKV